MTPNRLAKYLEPSSLPATDDYWDNDDLEDRPLDEHRHRRNKMILDKFKSFFEEYKRADHKIAIVVSISHAEIIGNYLCQEKGFHVASAVGINIIEF